MVKGKCKLLMIEMMVNVQYLYSEMLCVLAVEFGVENGDMANFSKNPKRNRKNHWTSTRLVCTHLRHFSCWIQILQCIIWIFNLKKMKKFDLMFSLDIPYMQRVKIMDGGGCPMQRKINFRILTLSFCNDFIWMSEVSTLHWAVS